MTPPVAGLELTAEQLDLIRRFPAKYTASIIDAIAEELFNRSLVDGVILDPFAGVGGIHQFAERYPNLTTLGIDIEEEQAALHPRTVHGDSRRAIELLPALRDAIRSPGQAGKIEHELRERGPFIDAIVTSPAYGNRLADQYLGSDTEKCQPCKGGGWLPRRAYVDTVPGNKQPGFVEAVAALPEDHRAKCGKCKGTGSVKSDRQGYAIALGRYLTAGSGAALPWGVGYRELHEAVIAEVAELLRPGGWWLVNISSALGQKGYMPVMEWWVGLIARHAGIVELRAIETPRSRKGANGDRRVPVEHLVIARAAL